MRWEEGEQSSGCVAPRIGDESAGGRWSSGIAYHHSHELCAARGAKPYHSS